MATVRLFRPPPQSGVHPHPPLPPFGVQSCVLTSGAVCTSSDPACIPLPSGPHLCPLSCFLDKRLLNQKPLGCYFLCTWLPCPLTVLLSIPERLYCYLEQPTTIPFSSCLFLRYFYVNPPPPPPPPHLGHISVKLSRLPDLGQVWITGTESPPERPLSLLLNFTVSASITWSTLLWSVTTVLYETGHPLVAFLHACGIFVTSQHRSQFLWQNE